MILSRCLVLAVSLTTAATLSGQTPGSPPASAPSTVAFPGDARAAKLAERYRTMLLTNPVEGIALDRWWKAWEDQGATAALISLAQADAAQTGSVSAWLIDGHVLKKAGRFEEAAAAYDRAARADPTSLLPLLAKGDLALARHDPAAAAPLLSDALSKLAPGDHRRTDLLMKLGSAWLAAGKPEKAAESWEQIVAANPANLALHKQLADAYAQSHLSEPALVHYDYIDRHADAPARAAALREAGRLHESRGEFDAARDAFERGEALTSRDNWLHGELQAAIIRLYQRAGREPELAARWRQAAEQAPRDLGGYLRLLALADAQGDTAGEKAWLEKITALVPRDRDSQVKLARLLAATGEREKAAGLYDRLLKDQPDQLELLFARADLDLQLAQPVVAINRLEARLAKSPADETVGTPILEFFLSHHLDEPAERLLRAAPDRQSAALEPGLALAKFYFARRRAAEGHGVLDVLANQPGTIDARKERWQRLAVTYREENLLEDAMRCWDQAARLAPQDPVPTVALGELLLARGNPQGAASAWQRAVDLTPEGAGREEIEHKLFQVLAAGFDQKAGGSADATAARPHQQRAMSLAALVAASRPEPTTVVPGSPLDRYLDGLDQAATCNPTPAKYLRLARWQLWAHAPAEAAATAEKAQSLDPGNVPARVLLVSLAVDANRREIAERGLRELIALDPAKKPAYLRQIASLQMAAGEFDAALAVYRELQEQQPGSADALVELAVAQQRADHWFDALAAWKRAYTLPSLTPAQRGDVRRPLVAAYEHLREFREGAELLRAAVDDQPELARKQELFHDLAEFCNVHALSDWLVGLYEGRLQGQPDDYFTMVAVAELRKQQGKEMEAYQLLARAYYSAPDPVAALKSLADEAEALGEDDQALVDRRRLIAMAGQNTSENLEKLALLEEDHLDDAASQTWGQIVTLFPRDTGALTHAAEFFERIDDPARARGLLTQVTAIDPGDVQRLFHLAELQRDAGDRDAAREKFEQVLARSEPEKPGEALRLPPELEPAPDPGLSLSGVPAFYRSRSSTPAPGPAVNDDRALRWRAIGELAHLLPGPDGSPRPSASNRVDPMKSWLSRWTAAAAGGARSEPLQALYAAQEVDATMDLLAAWMAQPPSDEQSRATFLLAGLHLGAYRQLAQWAWPEGSAAESASRGPLLVEALVQFLAMGGKPADGMVGELFPPRVKARDLLWKAAREGFAEHSWYAQAAELGERVALSVSSGRAAYAVETARWELFLGRADHARAVLGDAIAEGGGIAYDGLGGSPVFHALRAYYLLLPVADRAGFVERYLCQWRDRGEPVHGILSAILLHGLQGDEETAKGELDTLLSMRMVGEDASGSPDVSRWNYLLVTGTQLESWNLGSLAGHLWRSALRELTAFDRQTSGLQSTLADIRSRLVGLEIATATDPEKARECVESYLHANPPAGLVVAEATQLMATSHFTAARQFYEYLTVLEPEEGENWRNLATACESEGDSDATERILSGLLNGPHPLPSSLNRAELVRQLAALRRNSGDAAGALRLLEHEFLSGTRGAPVTTTLAQEYERADMLDDAVRVWQGGLAADPPNARNYRLALARVEERRGNLPGAISMLETEVATKVADGGDEPVLRLAKLYLSTGRLEDAKRLALGALEAKQVDALAGLARVFIQAGRKDVALGWLATAVRRSRDPQTRFQLQREFLQANLKPTDLPLADFVRELRRLRRIARATPTLSATCDSVSYELADRRGADAWLEGELKHAWQNGEGDFAAAERLIGFYLDRHQTEPVRLIVQTIQQRPNLPDQSLLGLEKRLVDADLSALALPISERLCGRYPQNEAFVLGRAQVLWKIGRPVEADRLLEDLDHTSVFREDLSPQIAALYQELGNTDRAREFYGRTVQRDPAAVRSPGAYLGLAHIEAGHKNWPEVRRLLFQVYRHPAAGLDSQPLSEYLCASGQGIGETSQRLSGDGFPLTFARRGQLIALVYEQLKTSGRKDEADQLIINRADFLAAAPALTAAIRGEKSPTQLPACAHALEQAITHADPPVPRLNRELAALYIRWSDQQANGDAQDAASRLAHLIRANQLVPDDFEGARRLAALSWELGQPAQAIRVLQPFLAATAVPAENQQARQLLARH